jgi:flagellar biosynthesis/type III secretory pathway protein FliH
VTQGYDAAAYRAAANRAAKEGYDDGYARGYAQGEEVGRKEGFNAGARDAFGQAFVAGFFGGAIEHFADLCLQFREMYGPSFVTPMIEYAQRRLSPDADADAEIVGRLHAWTAQMRRTC